MTSGKTFPLSLPQSVQQCRCALAPAQSPAFWQQDLSRQKTKLGNLEPPCHWVKSLKGLQVKLQPEPIWGGCLATLTGGEAPAREAVAGGRSPSPSTRSHSQEPPRRPTAAACPPAHPATRRTASTCTEVAPVLQLPKTAPNALLCKHGDEEQTHVSPIPASATRGTKAATGEPPLRSNGSKPLSNPQRLPTKTDRTRNGNPAPPENATVAATQHWMQQVSGRSRDRLRSTPTPAAMASTPIPAADQGSRKARVNLPETDGQESSPSPWTQPIEKPLVLRHQLQTWAHPEATPTTSAEPERQQTARPASQKDPLSRSQPPASVPDAEGASFPGTFPRKAFPDAEGAPSPGASLRKALSNPSNPGSRSGNRVAPVPQQGTASPGQSPLPGQGAIAHPSTVPTVQYQGAAADAIAPPAVTPTLPPLSPSQVAGIPTPDIASPMIRQTAQEGAIAGDDLNLLAHQLKRILDEEARRHGINI